MGNTMEFGPGTAGLAYAPTVPGTGLPPLAPAKPSKSDKPGKGGFPLGRALRIGMAGLLLATGTVFVMDRFWSVRSTLAVLDATPITIRAPIDGVLRLEDVAPGVVLSAGHGLGSIRDEQIDRSRQAQLAASVHATQQEIDALTVRLQELRAQARDAQAHFGSFRNSRIQQLSARLQEAEVGIAAAHARQQEAVAALRRAEDLANGRVVSAAALDQARRAAAVAQTDVAAAVQRRNAAQTEVAAAQSGVFGSDNSTDRSTSQQLQEQLRLQEGELRAQLEVLRGKLAGFRSQLEAEDLRLERSSQASLTSAARARVADLLVQDGEFVRRGQSIAVLMDCRRPRVTAQVDERSFRALHIGKQGVFVSAQGSERMRGEVVQLSSPLDDGAGRSNAYRVVLRLDPQDVGETCPLGRSGRVEF
ncbi:HlyD family secretion protein [Roseomonas chloroacetimidivorans]|uniref:HlyD family secretion protein n=1 Tax=Roseomonas chloroacetimidivorans TaxID=1766656 RepID=UPI003C773222